MTAAEKRRAIVRPVAYRAEDAAVALGLSPDAFREHVAPHVRAVPLGRLRLYRVPDLDEWANRRARLPLEGEL